MYSIYGLHRGDGQYRYVGATGQALDQRLSGHIYSARRGSHLPVHKWIRSHDFDMQIESLMTYQSEEAMYEAESTWIENLRAAGFSLLNVAPGGRVLPDQTGQPHSDERKANISAGVREAYRRKLLGLADQPPYRLSERQRLRGLELSDVPLSDLLPRDKVIIAAYCGGLKVADIAAALDMNATAVHNIVSRFSARQ